MWFGVGTVWKLHGVGVRAHRRARHGTGVKTRGNTL